MNGKAVQSALRPPWRPYPAVLGDSRLQCLAMPQRQRSASLHRPFAVSEKHQQRRPVPSVVGGQAARLEKSDDLSQKSEGFSGCRAHCGNAQGRQRQRRATHANALPADRLRSLRKSNEVHRGKQGNERMEGNNDAGHGARSHQESRGRSAVGDGKEEKKPSPKIGCYQSKKWSGQAFNQSKKWTKAYQTPSKSGLGDCHQIDWRVNASAGFSLTLVFSPLQNHSPRNGLLSTVAILGLKNAINKGLAS